MTDNSNTQTRHLITRDDPRIASFLGSLSRLEKSIDNIESNYKPSILDERYLTDKQLSEWLHIARCTLLEYRNAGILPYYLIGGKIYYKESEIDKLFKDNFNAIIP